MSDQLPLSSLAQTSCATDKCAPKAKSCEEPCPPAQHHQHKGYGGYFAWAILWFIILAVIVWLILLAAKPTWVQNTDSQGRPTGDVNNGKAVLWAVIIAFIICIIIWLLKALVSWSSY